MCLLILLGLFIWACVALGVAKGLLAFGGFIGILVVAFVITLLALVWADKRG